jgi:hypothetical protein
MYPHQVMLVYLTLFFFYLMLKFTVPSPRDEL